MAFVNYYALEMLKKFRMVDYAADSGERDS